MRIGKPRSRAVSTAATRASPALRRALTGSVLTGLSGQAALIVSGVVAARMLGVENRGNLALLTVLPLMITLFGSLGLPLAVTYEIAREQRIARALLRQLRPFIVLQTLALTLVHLAILAVLVREQADEFQIAACLTMLAVPSLIALQYGLAILQGQQRYRQFNVLRLAPAVFYASLALAIFIGSSGSLPVFAAGIAASWLLVGAATSALAIHGCEPCALSVDVPDTRRLVKFGLRAVVGWTSASDGAGLDQLVVGLFLSARALGLYVVAAAFMNLSRLVTQSIGLVAYPNVAGRRNAEDARRAMWRFTTLGTVAALAITVVLELTVHRLIELLFGASFVAADGVARVLLIAALLAGARRVLSEAARGANRPLAGTVAEISSWACLIPALVLLTPLFGLYGVAAALGLAAAASLFVILRAVRSRSSPASSSASSDASAPLA